MPIRFWPLRPAASAVPPSAHGGHCAPSAPEGAERARVQRIQAERIRLLYAQSLPASALSMVLSVLFVATMWDATPSHPGLETALWTWLTASFFSSVIRVILFTRYNFTRPSNLQLLNWVHPFYLSLLLSTSIWGFGLVLITPRSDWSYQVVAFCFAIGMTSGALTSYSAIPRVVTPVAAILLVPITGSLIALAVEQERTTPLYLGICGILLFLAALRAITLLTRTLDEYLEARFEMERAAHTDALTELPNRRAFMERLGLAVGALAGRPDAGALIMIDVDHFKSVNDRHGHAAGDQVLRHVASVLRAHTHEGSEAVCRLGGEEFSLCLPGQTVAEAAIRAELLRAAMACTPCPLNASEPITVTVSLGVAPLRSPGPLATPEGCAAAIDEALSQSDTAMYEAKRKGRNQVVCHVPEPHARPGPPPPGHSSDTHHRVTRSRTRHRTPAP